eukprot:1077172_1
MAYQYADRNIRNAVGDKLYEYEEEEDDNGASKAYELLKEWGLQKYVEELIDENGYDDVSYWHVLTQEEDDNGASKAYELLKEWGLQKYVEELIDENGYDDVSYWHVLTQEELMDEMGFKKGHARKFVSLAKTI